MDRRLPIDWLLRFAVAGAFIGHGAYGAVLQKDSWFGYFAVLGISSQTVLDKGLCTVIGGAEIGMGLLALDSLRRRHCSFWPPGRSSPSSSAQPPANRSGSSSSVPQTWPHHWRCSTFADRRPSSSGLPPHLF